MNFERANLLICLCMAAVLFGCGQPPQVGLNTGTPEEPRFRVLDSTVTGIGFVVRTVENDEINYFRYTYIYNSGAVAIGDLNGDGAPDLVIGSSQQGCRVYLNQGHLRFIDITQKSGVEVGGTWVTGITLADVDANGTLDIYVCASGPSADPEKLRNKLFLNDGNANFNERSAAFGIDDAGNTHGAHFVDMDRDGDLDLYLMGHRVDFQRATSVITDERFVPYTNETDRLYINTGNGRFQDHTEASGLLNKAFSLGSSVGDMNGDGLPDIYVSNDFTDPDALYIAAADGTYRNEINVRMGHCSYFSMGMDRADINNDGLPDLLVVDMTPADHRLSKENMASMSPATFARMVDHGYPPQYMTNALQLAQENGTFIDIAHLAGVDRTDWSWSPLILDLDNDGHKDIHITNGVKRDVTNSDFRAWADSVQLQKNFVRLGLPAIFSKIPSHIPENSMFRNNGDLTFSHAEEQWGYHHATISTGSAYGDLDGDGDLDLVTVDQDAPVRIIENLSRDIDHTRYVQFELKGGPGNHFAIGSAVKIFTSEGLQMSELYTTRGFQSCVEPIVHFGLGNSHTDSIQVIWYDGTVTTLQGSFENQRIPVDMNEAKRTEPGPSKVSTPLFEEVRAPMDLWHTENEFNDFALEILLPNRQSEHGPAIAVADVDGDGHEDIFVTASVGTSPVLLFGTKEGSFTKKDPGPWSEFALSEFIGVVFFDADGDSDEDLYLAAGSTEYEAGSPHYQDRFFRNRGDGTFALEQAALPEFPVSTQCIVPFDVDGDGDLDLFAGGRNVPGAYPSSPRSAMLINDGRGTFSDASSIWLPSEKLGMITAAAHADMDGNGHPDLVLVGEWTSVMVLYNSGSSLAQDSTKMPDHTMTGWWQGLAIADLDKDGDQDMIVGGLGTNNKFHPSPAKPLKVYMGDMDSSNTNDIILAKTSPKGELPVRGRECSSQQLPFIKERFPTYKGFAAADLRTIYGSALEHALQLQATEFRSLVLINTGGRFQAIPLPNEAQVAPIRSILVQDPDRDGHLDLIVAGNLYGTEVETTRYDAGTGMVLKGNSTGEFVPLRAGESGFSARHDARELVPILVAGREGFLVANNSASLQLFLLNSRERPELVGQR